MSLLAAAVVAVSGADVLHHVALRTDRAKLHVNANRTACVCVAKLKNVFDLIYYCYDCGLHREHGGSRQPIASRVLVCTNAFGTVFAG